MSHRISGVRRLAVAAALFGAAASAHAVTEVQLWHAMSGALNDRVVDLATRFNEARRTTRSSPSSRAATPSR